MYVPLPFCPGSAFLPPALTMFILCHRTKRDLTQLKSLTREMTCRSNSAARLGLSRSRTLSVPAPRSAPSLPLTTFPEFVRRSTLTRGGKGGGGGGEGEGIVTRWKRRATVAYGEIGEGVIEAAGFQFWGISLAKPPLAETVRLLGIL